jgi:peptidoglycan/LPS O-acetylase OafA/YrhL
MARPLLIEAALFLLPFVAYAAFLLVARAGKIDSSAWSPPRLAWLVIVALVLMIGSFLMLAEFGRAPPDSTYVPAHLDGGQLRPGETK